jgi:uncharacterized membrane protein
MADEALVSHIRWAADPFGMILMQPWRALSPRSWAMLSVGFGWAVTGRLIGAAPTLLAVKVVRLARRKN